MRPPTGVLLRPGMEGTPARSAGADTEASSAGTAWPALGLSMPTVPASRSPPGSVLTALVAAPVSAGFVSVLVGSPSPPAAAGAADAVPAAAAAIATPRAATPATLRVACFMSWSP